MKVKEQFLRPGCLIVLASFSACGTQGMKPPPLPDNVSITAPRADVDSQARAFSGKWVGMWIGAVYVAHALVIEDIDGTEASVLYSTGESERTRAGWVRVKGSIVGNTLTLSPFQHGAQATYRLLPDGTLAGVYAHSGFNSVATMKRAGDI